MIIMNATSEYTDPYPFEDFAPTLSQCFVLVFVGYLLSKLEILTASDVKGVISLASYFAMPGIICVSLMDANFGDFRWELLFGIFLGKLFTFVVIATFWVMLKGNIGVTGVVALFCTQSNDLPVGNPLMSSLYNDYRPQMMKYLFHIPAMTVIFFVPVSNIMLKVHRQVTKNDPNAQKAWWKYIHKNDIVHQLLGIAKNPVVIATVCGLILNLALKGNIPEVLHQPIKVAAATIPGIALVMLGFSFVRKERHLLSSAVVPAAVLFMLKMVITPIMLHSILRVLTGDKESAKMLTDFALLYGIVSPATAVFLIGGEFRKAQAVMSVALIVSSLVCFPLSYVIARATIAPVHEMSSYIPILKEVLFWIACITLCSDVITGAKVMWKIQKQTIFLYISCLIFTQAITCCGLLVWTINTDQQPWTIYCEMILYFGGEISGYIMTGTLAVILVYRHKKLILTKRNFYIISCTAFSVSGIITIAMCLLIPQNALPTVYVIANTRSNFEFQQLMITSILLFVSLSIVAICLTYYFKSNGKAERSTTEDYAYENTVFYIENAEEIMEKQNSKELVSAGKVQESTKEANNEKLKVTESENSGVSVEEREWTFRLSSLLILQGLVMLVRFIANLYKLVRSKQVEVMIPMEFLQSTLFIGQGIFMLLIFGVDVRTMIIRLKKYYRNVTHRGDSLPVRSTDLDTKEEGEIWLFCNQFLKFYYHRCYADIAKERRWKDNIYKDCFWGPQLVDWLITEGICQDDVDAESQGQKLLEGGVIQHISQKHNFYDAHYLYQFVNGKRIVTNITVKF